jgi:hypothetical protein
VPNVLKSGSHILLVPLGPDKACNGIALPTTTTTNNNNNNSYTAVKFGSLLACRVIRQAVNSNSNIDYDPSLLGCVVVSFCE